MGPQSAPIGDWPRKRPDNAFCVIEIALNLRLDFFPYRDHAVVTASPYRNPAVMRVRSSDRKLWRESLFARELWPKPKTAVPFSSNSKSPVPFCPSHKSALPRTLVCRLGAKAYGANFFLPVSFVSKPKTVGMFKLSPCRNFHDRHCGKPRQLFPNSRITSEVTAKNCDFLFPTKNFYRQQKL